MGMTAESVVDTYTVSRQDQDGCGKGTEEEQCRQRHVEDTQLQRTEGNQRRRKRQEPDRASWSAGREPD